MSCSRSLTIALNAGLTRIPLACQETAGQCNEPRWFSLPFWVALCVLGFTTLVALPACGATFKLAHGGTLEGVWIDGNRDPVTQFEIQLRGGGRIVLAAAAVKEVIRSSQIERQYQLKVGELRKDVAGHQAIAAWCGEHGMEERRRYHLQRILRIDENHAEARRALGYSFVRGQWMTHNEFMRQQGYEKYKGHWKSPQEIELLESKRARDVAARQWYRQLSRWRRALETDRAGEFYKAIAEVRDPLAIPALIVLTRRESLWPVRQLYMQTMASIGTPQALHGLLELVLVDADEETVFASLDLLAKVRSPSIHDELAEKLRDESNVLVNRAAVALGRLGEESAIDPLIDALVTYHRVKRFNRYTDQMELVTVEVKNRDVLSTLTELTGTNGFGYDEKAWKQWRVLRVKQAHAVQVQSGPATVRRDER